MQDDPYLPTDVTSFYTKNVPVLNFFTGAHEDYHRPTDTAEKLNYDGLERVTKFVQQIIVLRKRPTARISRKWKEAVKPAPGVRHYVHISAQSRITRLK